LIKIQVADCYDHLFLSSRFNTKLDVFMGVLCVADFAVMSDV